jgi:hypothetical protein
MSLTVSGITQNTDGTWTISPKRYSELLEAEHTLHKLYAAGVENWEWYEDALDYEGDSTDGT